MRRASQEGLGNYSDRALDGQRLVMDGGLKAVRTYTTSADDCATSSAVVITVIVIAIISNNTEREWLLCHVVVVTHSQPCTIPSLLALTGPHPSLEPLSRRRRVVATGTHARIIQRIK